MFSGHVLLLNMPPGHIFTSVNCRLPERIHASDLAATYICTQTCLEYQKCRNESEALTGVYHKMAMKRSMTTYSKIVSRVSLQMSFITSTSAADTQPLVELVLEVRAEVTVNVTDVDSLVSSAQFCLRGIETSHHWSS